MKEGWTIYDRGFGTIGPIKITNTVLLFRTRVAQTAYQSGDVVNVQVIGPSSRQNSKPLLVESTEQFIDIVLPEEGEWTVYINHGDVSPDKNYYSPRNIAVDVSFWPISLSSTGVNGSLSVESPSPLSATIGSKETLNIAWEGAAEGGRYFGAISHIAYETSMEGLTIVLVDNEKEEDMMKPGQVLGIKARL